MNALQERVREAQREGEERKRQWAIDKVKSAPFWHEVKIAGLEAAIALLCEEVVTKEKPATGHSCFDCGHPINHHSGQARGTGCYDCPCPRWFEYGLTTSAPRSNATNNPLGLSDHDL